MKMRHGWGTRSWSSIPRLMLHYAQGDGGGVLAGMVDLVVCSYAFDFVVIAAAGVEVAVEAREIAAADFDAELFARSEVVAGLHGLEGDLVDLVLFHEDGRLVVAFAVAGALDVFVDVVGGAVGENIDELDGEVGVFGVA